MDRPFGERGPVPPNPGRLSGRAVHQESLGSGLCNFALSYHGHWLPRFPSFPPLPGPPGLDCPFGRAGANPPGVRRSCREGGEGAFQVSPVAKWPRRELSSEARESYTQKEPTTVHVIHRSHCLDTSERSGEGWWPHVWEKNVPKGNSREDSNPASYQFDWQSLQLQFHVSRKCSRLQCCSFYCMISHM